LPRHLLDALLDGFAWDGHERRYETMEDLHGYAARVAGSVGAMMCWIMGPQQAVTLARACELGVAMQLTNIARDVGEDARIGRVYLPLQWLRDEGIDPDTWLLSPTCTPALQRVVERVLQEADSLYKQSTAGIAHLPRDCRSAIMSANLIYAEIGHQLRRSGMDPVNQRSVVSGKRKLWLLARAWFRSQWVQVQRHQPQPLAGIAYLVDQCQLSAQTLAFEQALLPKPPRIETMLTMFERLEMQRRQAAGQRVNRYL
jgi:phytoene synthase